MPNSLILQPGMSIGGGRYVIDRLLKQGRSSLTLQGTQVSNGRSLIFKFPLQDQGLLPAHQQRFQQIWQRLGHFQHPYLQQTVDYLEVQGVPCLVLEQISGRPLAQGITSQTPLAEATALRLIFQIAQGVQQLHDRGIVHGDLKPQNLIEQPHGKAIVVVDWGLFWQGWNSQPLSPYSAPEPFTPPEVRASVDVYSLAACFYTLVTGHPPIAAAQQLTTPLVPPQSLIPSLTPVTQEAILQGMNLNPDRRPKSVQAWLTLLPQPYASAQLPKVQAAPVVPAPPVVPSPPAAAVTSSPAPLSPSDSSPPIAQTVATRIAAPRPKPPSSTSNPSNPSRSPVAAHAQTFRPLLISVWVMTIAGVLGFSFGGLLRWQQSQNSLTPSFFEKAQSFPTQDWPGTLDLAFPDDAPLPETAAAADDYEPYLDWSPVAPTDSLDQAVPSADFSVPYQPEAPVAMPRRDSSPDPSVTETSVDPSEPLPNVNSPVFEDPLYVPPEEPAPAEEPPPAAPADPSTDAPPPEPSPPN